MTKKQINIAIVAGEASGDLLGASLIIELKKIYPNASFMGVGGFKMQKEGLLSLFDLKELSVMGITEVILNLRKLIKLNHKVSNFFILNPPDIYIGIDAPDFNLPIEKKLKKNGVKTVHYISPSIWAWREKRIFKIKEATDLVLGILPFEEKIYLKYKTPYKFIGHFLADKLPLNPCKEIKDIRSSDVKIISILPGSRSSEIKNLFMLFIQAIDLVKKTFSNIKVLIPYNSKESLVQIQDICNSNNISTDEIEFIHDGTHEALRRSDAALITSGTAVLESMLLKTPTVVGYKMSKLTYQIAKKMVKTKYVTLPNLIADEEIFKEFIQDECTSENLAKELVNLLSIDNSYIINKCYEIHKVLQKDSSKQAAIFIKNILDEK
ncbi:MAG: lipid-A-disaccharide synthase [Psittacicella sp.]